MFAGNEKNLLGLGCFQSLVQRVVFARLGHVTQVAGVNDEVGFLWQAVDLVDGRLQRGDYIGISRLVKAHVGVADLDEMKRALRALHLLAESLRSQNAAANTPDDPGSSPGHALQKAATVNAVFIVV